MMKSNMARRDNQYVLSRIETLREQNTSYLPDRWRIRNIMNGGTAGIAAIMAWDKGKGSSGKTNSNTAAGTDLPAVNMMASGVERLAQKVGATPTLKMPYGPRDSQPAREAAEKRERIVEGWDHLSQLDMQFPQVGRWLPGYGFAAWVIRPRRDRVTGQLWPHAELRDPFDTWPGFFGTTQQPTEVAFVRSVPLTALEANYPEVEWGTLFARRQSTSKGPTDPRLAGTQRVIDSTRPTTDTTWEGVGGGTQIIEFYDQTGIYLAAPEFGTVFDFIENPCDTGPLFVVGKRFSFDRLVSQYHHVIGLVAMMAKMNVLGLIATEDSVFKETNIVGDLEGNTYERGHKAVNFFEPGTRIERPQGDNPGPLFAQIDRLERQLRIGAAYDAGSDSMAARGGFITGQGQRELRDPIDTNIAEYQKVIAHAVETLDTRRLEWEEKTEKAKTKKVFWIQNDRYGSENYTPNVDIGGNWRTRRVYGMMATWDESQKLVGGLQLVGAGIIDKLTLQENIHGIDETPKVNQRIAQGRAQDGLFAALEQRAAEGDPGAIMALIEIRDKPQNVDQILKKFFTPQGQELSPEEQAMMAGQGQMGQMGQQGAPMQPPNVQTVLSEIAASGATKGGAQSVTVNRR